MDTRHLPIGWQPFRVIDEEQDVTAMATGFLRSRRGSGFHSICDVVEFAGQILEGLEIMHSRGTTHQNSLTETFTICGLDSKSPISGSQKSKAEILVGVAYSPASRSVQDAEDKPEAAINSDHWESEVVLDDVSCDLFKTEFFMIGDVFRRLYDKFCMVGCLEPLIASMTHPAPNERPTAAQALQLWKTIHWGITSAGRQLEPRSTSKPPVPHPVEVSPSTIRETDQRLLETDADNTLFMCCGPFFSTF
ncbi:hypothetical protein BV25DRAFT_1912178 [Artomyces pyxidatus]|uniref:Uncharacterized protein n=1 Tax=Artomyces pyxidatus TaxID=48021 RepID=A0ACB8TEL1_9AGAM|nr:hypothetical protein BV25DRAFT_1912178 [Artomyces pyxidatus]